MGLLDNNKILTSPLTGLEGSNFKKICSTDVADIYQWHKTDSQTQLKLTYKNLYAWVDANNLYLVKGEITDEPIVIEINSTNFPNLVGTPYILWVVACPCTFVKGSNRYGSIGSISADDTRICVIFSNGQIYHNYPSCYNDHDFYNSTYAKYGGGNNVLIEELFSKFDESVVWDLPNRKHPVKTTTGTDADLIATGKYYYNPALPDVSYELHPAINAANGYGNTVGFASTNNRNDISTGGDIGLRARFWRPNMNDVNCNSFSYMGGYVADNLFTMIGTYRTNTGNNPCRICVFGTQDGGRNWYNMYEFAGEDYIASGTYLTYGENIGIKLAQSGSTGSGIYMVKRRKIVAPVNGNVEPEHKFLYDSPINVEAVTGDENGITFTVSSIGDLHYGDCIVVEYQDNVSANGRAFDWMVNDATTADSGGNGMLFKVSDVSGNTFKVSMYIWNPDSNLPVRHIHALNRCKDGVAISTGENMPKGGWIIYNSIIKSDAFSGYNVASLDVKDNNFIRLNSTRGSYHRSLGTIVRQEADGTYCYISMDEAGIPAKSAELPEGRNGTLPHNSTGVYRVKVDGIDSLADNGELLYHGIETAFGFQQVCNAFVYTGQYGDLEISIDDGKTWVGGVMPNGSHGQQLAHFSGPTLDRKFSIDNILVQLKK